MPRYRARLEDPWWHWIGRLTLLGSLIGVPAFMFASFVFGGIAEAVRAVAILGAALLLLWAFGTRKFSSANGLQGTEPTGWTPKEALTPEAFRVRAWMKRLAEPTFLFVWADEQGFSKRGGEPDLPIGTSWPKGWQRPCEFLFQIDLADIWPSRAPSWFPTAGRLYAFVEPDANDRKDSVRVLYDAGQTATMQTPAPEGVLVRPQLRLGFRRFMSAPSIDWLGPKAGGYKHAHLREEAAGADNPSFNGVSHRLGGFPDEVNSQCLRIDCEVSARNPGRPWPERHPHDQPVPPNVEKASWDWRMLLQIECDDEAGWRWSHGGTLFVFVRKQDAAALDFSRTITWLQNT